ncbi:MAG: hypothetical protein WC856_06685 [Methylococcaceae bacterium]|jgi:hypothetical protein
MSGSAIANTQIFFLDLKARLRTLARRAELDRAVLYAILARTWGFAAGPVSALLIATKFTPTIQGFYYTFGSILALQTFAELGIGFAITQFASHEWANLRIGENRRIEGDPNSLSRLASLAQIAIKWYSIAAVFVIVGLSIGGYVFFSQSPTQDVSWKLPWISLCVFTGINLFTIAIWSLLEGCNQVSNVYFYRFFQGLCGSLAAWSSILLGADLWTASIVSLVGLIYAGIFLRKNYWEFFKSLLLIKPEGPRVSWAADILPFQWRIALSWVSGYFIFSFFTPVLFKFQGPVIAGQMGMTLALIRAAMAISSSWIGPRTPQMAILTAQNRYNELDALFFKLTKISGILSILSGLSIWLIIYFLYYINSTFAYRLLPPIPAGIFLLGQLVIAIPSPCANYMRAHKKEPLLFLSVLNGIFTGISTFIFGKYFSVIGIASGFLILNLIMQPLVVLIWYRFRIKYHGL